MGKFFPALGKRQMLPDIFNTTFLSNFYLDNLIKTIGVPSYDILWKDKLFNKQNLIFWTDLLFRHEIKLDEDVLKKDFICTYYILNRLRNYVEHALKEEINIRILEKARAILLKKEINLLERLLITITEVRRSQKISKSLNLIS